MREKMNEIAFVIAPTEYGAGPADGVEPVVDGMSIVDVFKRADGRRNSYAGLTGIDRALASWAPSEEERAIHLLGCACGDPDCSSVRARLVADSDSVVWSGFWASSPPLDRPEGRDYPEIGPFRFDRREYEAALANPRPATGPVRQPDHT
jgi:hypothetical protein